MQISENEQLGALRARTAETLRAIITPELSQKLDRFPEEHREFPHELFMELVEAGFVGFRAPKEYGGGGYSSLEYLMLAEELCYLDPAIGLLCLVPQLGMQPIIAFASEEQKQKYLPRCTSGELVTCFALTEPNAGSDANNTQTIATEEGDEFIINGEKTFIMHGDAANLAVVFCRIADDTRMSAILVETDQPGWEARTLRYKMGMRAATTGHILLKDVRAPQSNLLGRRGLGFIYAMQTLDTARIGVAGQGVGIMRRMLDECVSRTKERIQFGAPISKLQAIQWKIADMKVRYEAARTMANRAAQLEDHRDSLPHEEAKKFKFSMEAAEAKLFCSECANFCVNEAMQIWGGYGFIGEFSVIEKFYRDQRVTEIYEGTSEVQRLVIAGNTLK